MNIAWKDGKLASATIRSVTGTQCKVRYGGKVVELNLKRHGVCKLDGQLGRK